MKVGTDGVLLGAWTPVTEAVNILDIGTGTGLVALMLAQRNKTTQIDAIEVEENAFKEAEINFTNTNWSDRLSVYHQALQSYNPQYKYDLIVSNPPYFSDGKQLEQTQRTLARHVDNLSFTTLLSSTIALLRKKGKCSFVLPFKEVDAFVVLAKDMGLFLIKVTHVRGRKDLDYKRSLLLFSTEKNQLEIDELVIEHERHVYTQEYISLTQDFYLKM